MSLDTLLTMIALVTANALVALGAMLRLEHRLTNVETLVKLLINGKINPDR